MVYGMSRYYDWDERSSVIFKKIGQAVNTFHIVGKQQKSWSNYIRESLLIVEHNRALFKHQVTPSWHHRWRALWHSIISGGFIGDICLSTCFTCLHSSRHGRYRTKEHTMCACHETRFPWTVQPQKNLSQHASTSKTQTLTVHFHECYNRD